MGRNIPGIQKRVRAAIRAFWKTRERQQSRQRESGQRDQGSRGAVTGGAQMSGFGSLLTEMLEEAGIASEHIFQRSRLELPGFFRPTKEWDLLVVRENMLLAVIEAKSQVGPSFGNNFNNRAEEAMGSALDLWTAYREHAYLTSPQPFLGYFLMLEDCEASNRPVKVKEPHFRVLPEFVGASYMRRYELFCRKLVLERHYTAAAFIASTPDGGIRGRFSTPAADISLERFARALLAHLGAFV